MDYFLPSSSPPRTRTFIVYIKNLETIKGIIKYTLEGCIFGEIKSAYQIFH